MLSRLERLYATILLVVFGGIVLHAPLSVYLGSKFPDQLLLIKSWKEILLALAGLLAIFIVSNRTIWRELTRDWAIRLVIMYIALHVMLVVPLYQGLTATFAGLAIDLRFAVFFLLVYLLIYIAPHYRKKMLIVGGVGASIVIGFGTLQLFLPKDILSYIGYSTETISPYLTVDKNPNYVRINSTLRGPNPLGAYTIIVLSLIATFVATRRGYFIISARQWAVGVATVCSLIVLWISYSRSSLIAGAVSLTLIAVILFGRTFSRRTALITGLIISLGILGTLATMQTSFFANVILHDNAETKGVSSNEAHLNSIITSLNDVVNQPFGAGIGSTGSASVRAGNGVIVENQYLFEAREGGWLGLALFAALYADLMQRLYVGRKDWLSLGIFTSGIGMAIIGILLPVWTDDTVSIVWWGLAAIAIGGVYGRKQTNQKTA